MHDYYDVPLGNAFSAQAASSQRHAILRLLGGKAVAGETVSEPKSEDDWARQCCRKF